MLTVVLAVGLALAPRAPPDPIALPLRIDWSVPPDCPDVDQIRADVERLTQQPVAPVSAATHELRGRITNDADGYHLELALEFPGRVIQRQLDAESCQTLSRAAGLIVAVAIAPLRATRSISMSESPASATPSAPMPPIPSLPAESLPPSSPSSSDVDPLVRSRNSSFSPRPAPDTPRRRLHHGVAFGVAAGAGLGWVPGLAGGVQGSAAWHFGANHLELLGAHWFARVAPVTAFVPENTGVRISASGGGLRLCRSPSASPLQFPLCLGAHALALSGSGRGPGLDSTDVVDLWLGVGPAVGMVWRPVARFALRVQFDALLAARRPGFHLIRGSDRVEAFRSPPISLGIMLGPQVRLR